MTHDEKVLYQLGRIEGELKGLTAQSELTRVAVEEQGKAIAALPCHYHRKRISDLVASVGQLEERVDQELEQVGEDTARIRMSEIQRKAAAKAKAEAEARAQAEAAAQAKAALERNARRRRLIKWAVGALIAATGTAIPLIIHFM